jgi:hypothetical protein
MARYQLLISVEDGQFRLPASTKIADSVANQQPGDIVSSYWTTSNHLTVNHVPLDSSAASAMVAAGFSGVVAGQRVVGAPATISGVDSIG